LLIQAIYVAAHNWINTNSRSSLQSEVCCCFNDWQ
jgi:hypothetical protein